MRRSSAPTTHSVGAWATLGAGQGEEGQRCGSPQGQCGASGALRSPPLPPEGQAPLHRPRVLGAPGGMWKCAPTQASWDLKTPIPTAQEDAAHAASRPAGDSRNIGSKDLPNDTSALNGGHRHQQALCRKAVGARHRRTRGTGYPNAYGLLAPLQAEKSQEGESRNSRAPWHPGERTQVPVLFKNGQVMMSPLFPPLSLSPTMSPDTSQLHPSSENDLHTSCVCFLRLCLCNSVWLKPSTE